MNNSPTILKSQSQREWWGFSSVLYTGLNIMHNNGAAIYVKLKPKVQWGHLMAMIVETKGMKNHVIKHDLLEAGKEQISK